jgi:hypothetical protein
MLGLNDEVIAHTPSEHIGSGMAGHERGNGAYVISRKPDYILFGPPRGASHPVFKSDKELFEFQEFKDWYDVERHEPREGFTITLYRRLSPEDMKAKKEAERKKKEKEASKKAKTMKQSASDGRTKLKTRFRRPEPRDKGKPIPDQD